mmetsp:Transcript_64639/g.88786  ORF Transcript_64639/g.88786 Transcript_64639/m.88786 type:complete len:105 (+) Transcript_64639:198-512(+)
MRGPHETRVGLNHSEFLIEEVSLSCTEGESSMLLSRSVSTHQQWVPGTPDSYGRVSNGTRTNLVVWARSTTHREAVGCPMCGEIICPMPIDAPLKTKSETAKTS